MLEIVFDLFFSRSAGRSLPTFSVIVAVHGQATFPRILFPGPLTEHMSSSAVRCVLFGMAIDPIFAGSAGTWI